MESWGAIFNLESSHCLPPASPALGQATITSAWSSNSHLSAGLWAYTLPRKAFSSTLSSQNESLKVQALAIIPLLKTIQSFFKWLRGKASINSLKDPTQSLSLSLYSLPLPCPGRYGFPLGALICCFLCLKCFSHRLLQSFLLYLL